MYKSGRGPAASSSYFTYKRKKGGEAESSIIVGILVALSININNNIFFPLLLLFSYFGF